MIAILITAQDVRDVRPIAGNIKDARIEGYIKEAQNVDLKVSLNTCGKDFVNYILNNTTDSDIELLLQGGEYTYDGETYGFTGINAALALYAYARTVEGSQFTVTGSGVTKKRTDYSDNAEKSDITALAASARTVAYSYMAEAVEMLCRLSDTYTQFGGVSNAPQSFRISGISRFKRTNNY